MKNSFTHMCGMMEEKDNFLLRVYDGEKKSFSFFFFFLFFSNLQSITKEYKKTKRKYKEKPIFSFFL